MKYTSIALIGVTQLVGQHAPKQKVTSSIPSQGTHLACGFGPQLGHEQEATDRCCSHSLSPSLPQSLRKEKERKGKERKGKERKGKERKGKERDTQAFVWCTCFIHPHSSNYHRSTTFIILYNLQRTLKHFIFLLHQSLVGGGGRDNK